jgi:hypothetical protein
MDRAIGIEGWVESHACADAYVLDLSFVVDGTLYGVPPQLGYRTIG